ncbi:SCP2 sterol-binding domain-containing protein [Mycobacterium sp. CVI_P3]|uniref:SCP2 sterol-binding domain-containing protein n=1 Tax=Mycobacterium pinniadriaticum TaxID=2994102 RepID=A0ABT3SMT7_9MYCO|nr:SCP2 sterol-binding domain-containing protein [Mycobacterium pinniadriaticum]MCX2934418.1 SCP2 sterol-binding domain-containing protein [Mycobacterium pinniadriaticum]MCX2940841.1 SCP2 sterol-binding domain-containing protein [Mycobacterium pinniadriaticum]
MGESKPVFGTLGFYVAMAEALNADPEWAERGKALEATMIYAYGEPINRYFYMRFEGGKVYDVTELSSLEERAAQFVVSGTGESWRAVMQKEVKPATAMATGKLKVKGKQTYLLKNMGAFTRILDVMTSLDPVYE